jgi:hypothetical protein
MRQQAMARYRRKRCQPRARKFPDGINPMVSGTILRPAMSTSWLTRLPPPAGAGCHRVADRFSWFLPSGLFRARPIVSRGHGTVLHMPPRLPRRTSTPRLRNMGAWPPNPQRRSDSSIAETRRTGSRNAANPNARRYRVDKGAGFKCAFCRLRSAMWAEFHRTGLCGGTNPVGTTHSTAEHLPDTRAPTCRQA